MATEDKGVQDTLIKNRFLEMTEPSFEAEYGILMFRSKAKPVWFGSLAQ